MGKIQTEITDSISKSIHHPPDNKELCDWCLQWVDLEKIEIVENKSPQKGFEFVCENCRAGIEE